MPTRNPIHAHFTVAGQKLPVSHFSLQEAISTPTELKVNLTLNHPIDLAAWLAQPVVFRISDDQGHARHWHLRCEKATLEQVGAEAWSASLVCASPWAVCFHTQPRQRVFCQSRLPELVDFILAQQGLPSGTIQWHLSHEAWQRDQIVQGHETDGAFIQRICGRENIQWFSRYDEVQEILQGVDHPRYLERRENPLIYHPREFFQDVPGSRLGVFEIERIHRAVLQEHDFVNDHELRRYSGIPCMQAGNASEGMPVKSYQPLHYEPSLLNKALRHRQIQSNDLPKNGYHALRLKSNLLDLAPGTVVEVAQGWHHINYVLHTATPTEGGELLLYQNTVILQDAHSPWRGILPKAPSFPLVFQAKIESLHEQTHLNANGRETVRSLLDAHSSESCRASIPIPRITPYAHASGGLQFPLYPGAEVLMTCLYGELDLPVILGTVFNEETRSPVNHLNPRINLIKTQQEQVICFDDTPGNESITLSTQSGHSWIMRQGEKPGIFVRCVGGMIIQSQGKQSWHTGEHFTIWAGQRYTQHAKVGQWMQTQRGDIEWKSHLDMNQHALRHMEMSAHQDAQLLCRDLCVQVKESQTITVQQGNAHLRVQGAHTIDTHQNITLTSLQGDISLTNQAGNCGIVLTQSGLIRVFGHQLLLSTELQKNAATIHHR
jgi:uncharacterized protein involved in type VI secretion and phage assembly